MRSLRWPCLALSMLVAWLGITPPVGADNADDAATKAAYLHNFTKFVEWPSLNEDVVHICVVGAESVVNVLAEIASRDLKGHGLQIWSGLDDPGICQILYIDSSEQNWRRLMEQVSGNAVLTVSDIDGFASQGGGIGFYRDGGQLKLEINPEAVKSARLRVNALLMEIARIAR